MAHPQHPLNGEIVKVRKREAGQWVIERPDGSLEKLPLAWAESVPPIIAQANRAGVVQAAPSEAWVGVTELLNLVKMIERLRAQPPEEVNDGNPSREVDTDRQSAGERDPGSDTNTRVGAISGGETSGADPGAGRDAAQADSGDGGAA